ncbi:MAG: ferritin [Verrucomicrobiota bacterium]
MLTDETVIKLLNEQIINEFESSQIYLAMSGWFETTPYKGFAAKYRAAGLEEHGHGMKFFDFLCDRDGPISIQAVPTPPGEYDSVLAAAKNALAQERKVSGQIRRIYEAAEEAEDYETKEFLHFFLAEQVQEEKEAKDFMEYVESAEGDPSALLTLDEQAGSESSSA